MRGRTPVLFLFQRAYASCINCIRSGARRFSSKNHEHPPLICCEDPSDSLQTLPTKPCLPHWGDVDKQDALLQSLCEKGLLSTALDALFHIRTPLSTHTYICLLKSCIGQKCLFHVKQVHTHIARHHINLSGALGDYLIAALAKCGGIKDALQLFQILPGLSAHSWAALVSVHADSSSGREVIELHRRMQECGVKPNSYVFVGLFKACGNIRELEYGYHLHAYACNEGLTTNVFVGNTLVSMYGKCGAVMDAENVFLGLMERDQVSWSALLASYVEQGEERTVLQLFRQMLQDGHLPNQHALVSSLQACNKIAEIEEAIASERQERNSCLLEIGRALHACARAQGFQLDVFLETTILALYGRCGALEDAINVFLGMEQHDLVAWTTLLSVLLQHSEYEKVLWLYGVMQEECLRPTESVFVVVIQACSMLVKRKQASSAKQEIFAFQIGKALHIDACKSGCVSNYQVGTALVSMYGAYGALTEAEQVFGVILHHDTVAWNAMLSVVVEQGQGERTLGLYRQMQVQGVAPNQSTFVLALQAYDVIMESSTDEGTLTKQACLEKIQVLHMDACKRGYTSNVIVGNVLLCLYGKHRNIVEAEAVFNLLLKHDIATWTAMLLAYVECGEDEKALWLHERMLKEGVHFDEVAFVCVLQACKEMGSLEVCQWRHSDIVSVGHESFPAIAQTIMGAYRRCSKAGDADAVFDGQLMPDILLWTTCISGHAGDSGRDHVAGLCSYEELILQGFAPDESTLASILSTCCHTGLVSQGLEYFLSINEHYNLVVEPFHYNVLFDLLGRAGDLQRIKNLLLNTPFLGDPWSWLCLLGVCSSHGDVQLAEKAFYHVIDLQPMQGSAYIIMSNIYTNAVQSRV